MTVFT